MLRIRPRSNLDDVAGTTVGDRAVRSPEAMEWWLADVDHYAS